MIVRIESSSGVPISRQIARQIRAQCATGALAPGAKLPSVRALARQLAVNQNTVLKVYDRLAMEGLLELRHGDGSYVADPLPGGQMAVQRDLLRRDVEGLVYRAAALGLGPGDVREMAERCFAELKRQPRGTETGNDGRLGD
jgi:GntR family transcriptional regulator